MAQAMTEGVYATNYVGDERYTPTKSNRTPPPTALTGSHLPLHAGRLWPVRTHHPYSPCWEISIHTKQEDPSCYLIPMPIWTTGRLI